MRQCQNIDAIDITSGQRSTDVIRRSLFSAQLSCTLTMLAPQLVAVIDSLIVSNTLGVDAFKAVSTLIPILCVSSILTGICCLGPSIQAGQAFGELNTIKAGKLFTLSMVMSSAIAIVMAGTMFFFNDAIIEKMTTDTIVEGYFRDYFNPMIVFLILCMPVSLLNTYTTAAGFASRVTVAVFAGGVVNVLFDIIFVIILHFGIAGAAWASILSCIVNIAVLFPMTFRKDYPFHFVRPGKDLLSLVRQNFLVWISLNSGRLSEGIIQLLGNIIVLHFLSSDGMFVWGICLIVMNLVLGVCGGVNDAYLYLDSSFVGEGDSNGRLKMAKLFLVELGIISSATAVLLIVFHNQIAILFGAETEAQVEALKVPLLCMALYSMIKVFFLSFELFSVSVRPMIKIGHDIMVCTVIPLLMTLSALFLGPDKLWYAFLMMIPIILLYVAIVNGAVCRKNKNLIPYFLFEKWPEHVALDVSIEYSDEDVEENIERIKTFLQICDVSDELSTNVEICCREIIDNQMGMPHTVNSFDFRLIEGTDEITVVVKSIGRPSSPLVPNKTIIDYCNKGIIPNEDELQLMIVNNLCSSIDYHYIYGMNETFMKFR